jgi:UDP-N-acetylglucosamine--N-acetylmuramyl-(pentapeptide) pyrophosphoryl-undecaprenol N-acetylglucosamine transferase
MHRIVLTGGGTGGHIIPNIAIIREIKKKHPDSGILYLGSKKGPEAKKIPEEGVNFKSVPAGKLRRYFSLQNIIDFIKVPFGILKAVFILKKFKPQVVFSKGGYVSLPVMYAAHLLRIPSILHESDVSPGLANKLTAKKADVICLSYPESMKYFPRDTKKVVTGNPVRDFIFKGEPENAYKITGFSKNIPAILVMGGSQGASHINETVFSSAKKLIKNYQLIHICGKGKTQKNISLPEEFKNRYKAFDYVDKELADLYSITDLAITRSGANSLAEIEALNIPAILIPLGKKASRGDQIINAEMYKKRHPETIIIEDENFNEEILINSINQILDNKSRHEKKSGEQLKHEAANKIMEVIELYLN